MEPPVRRTTPESSRPASRAGQARGTRGTGSQRVVPSKPPFTGERRILLLALTWLAVLQGFFFVLSGANAISRIVGFLLAFVTVLALQLLRNSETRRLAVILALAVLAVLNFVLHLAASSAPFPFRLLQVAILLGYAAAGVASVISLTRVSDARKALLALAGVTAVLFVAEAAIGGVETGSPAGRQLLWEGETVRDSLVGQRFVPSVVAKTIYPDNPRGYFDEPDALQRRWQLFAREGSKARLEFPPERRGVLRVRIDSAPGKVVWHVTLTQQPIRVLGEERYEVRFRARADSTRTMIVGVSQAHTPYDWLGLYREVRVDTTWRDFSETFRALSTDRVARLHFELGGSQPTVELTQILMRSISTNRAVQTEPRRELSVSYRINREGCRGPDYEAPARPGTWRILSLGDGSAFGVGVHESDTYVSRLQRLLNEPGARRGSIERYDVINCGTRGASTRQTRALYDSLAARYAPNVVVVEVNPGDQLPGVDEDVAAASRVGKYGQLLRTWGALRAVSGAGDAPPDFEPIVRELRELGASARSHGARLAVLVFQHRRGARWDVLASTLERGLRDAQVPVLKLGPALLTFPEEKLLVHAVYDRHPNELAHRVAAEALRKFLADEGLLGQGSSMPPSVAPSATGTPPAPEPIRPGR